jgi:beta-lactamase class A
VIDPARNVTGVLLVIASCAACQPGHKAERVAAVSGSPAVRRPAALPCVAPYRDQKAAKRARRALVTDLARFVSHRAGRVGVMARDLRTGKTIGYRQNMHEWITASGAKVDILVTLLRQARTAHRRLSAAERENAVEMITHSDNRAADALYRRIGGGSALMVTYEKLGMRNTTPGPGQYWGGTTTSPADRIRLMSALVRGVRGLHPGDRRYVLDLMEHVEPAQRWGVSAAAGRDDRVALKNGWTPRPFIHNTWAVTSYGHVYGPGHDYAISVQTDVQPGMGAGVTTIERLSRMIAERLPRLDPVRYRPCQSLPD